MTSRNFLYLLLLCFCSCEEPAPQPQDYIESTENKGLNHEDLFTWDTKVTDGVLQINYGYGIYLPQVAALHLNDSYLRIINSEEAGWGTSVILAPSFWQNGSLHQGTPIQIQEPYKEENDLLIDFVGEISGLYITGEIRFQPLDTGEHTLKVIVSIETQGEIELDKRPGEAFKIITLSSMNLDNDKTWDSKNAFINDQIYAFPDRDGWIIDPPVPSTRFGLNGGNSAWKQNAPTHEIFLESPFLISGWKTYSMDPNDDNLAFWAASDSLVQNWKYTIVARKGE